MYRNYLISGGTGSFGKTMLRSLLDDPSSDAERIVIFSRDEEKQDALRTSLRDDRIKFMIGDVRDHSSVSSAMKGIDCVFHAAALKQVPSCEFFPMEAVKTNVEGSHNVIKAAISNDVKSVVCLSTDKAVFPVNAMGVSKAMMEKIAQAAARELGSDGATKISSVRYGNVMYSRGSVLPLFVSQIKNKKPITLTVPEMTRFLMPLRDSASLVKFAFDHAEQGDLFIQKAVSATMKELVEALTQLFDVPDHPVEIIGWRHGEKLFETLATSQELANAEDMGLYWRIKSDLRDLNYKPYFSEGNVEIKEHEDFHSHNATRINAREIADLLMTLPEMQEALNK